jgi:hypothetical protein
MPTSFIRVIILFHEAFKCGDGAEFDATLWQTLNHYVYNFVVFCKVIYLFTI